MSSDSELHICLDPPLTDDERAAIIRVFDSHFNPSLLTPRKFNDPLFDMVVCFDPTYLAGRISRVWNEIFFLFGWNTIGNGKHTKPGIYVEFHNTWSTLCNRDKAKAIMELGRSVYDREVVFGAIVDKEPKDYHIETGVRILTGDHFLKFMLPSHEEIFGLLHSLMEEFNERHLVPYMRNISRHETETGSTG